MVLVKSAKHKSEKHVSVAASGKYYLISPGPRIFVFYIQQDATKYLFSKILFHRWCLFNFLISVSSKCLPAPNSCH